MVIIAIIYWILQSLIQMHTKFFVFLSPSEDVVAGKESNSTLEWTSQLKEIINLQRALDTAKMITFQYQKTN